MRNIKILLSCFCLMGICLTPKAQTLERKVFSNGGGEGTIGPNVYLYTFGEPIVGTATMASIILTKGFHQPLDISVLPLELRNFSAEWQENEVRLDWLANLEMEEGILVVERSQDGQNFHNIAELAAQSPDASLVPYQYTDTSVRRIAVSQIWYRISLISYNGEIKQSDLVSVKIGEISAIQLGIYPNPNNGNFKISYYLKESTKVRMLLLNHLGQIVWQESRQLPPGRNVEDMQLTQLAAGSYFLRIQTPRQSWSRTLVIKH
ncbi:MAG: T9SS type A sorting domain-containing protein [Bacteroidota bacterium]